MLSFLFVWILLLATITKKNGRHVHRRGLHGRVILSGAAHFGGVQDIPSPNHSPQARQMQDMLRENLS